MNKKYINQKVSYTAGVYGCTGEQFQLIVVDGDTVNSYLYDGLFGHEYRIEQVLKDKGYSQLPILSISYDKTTRSNLKARDYMSEYQMIEVLKELA